MLIFVAPFRSRPLDFPIDILFSPVTQKLISWGSITSPLSFNAGPSSEAIESAISLIRAAERPAIVIGSGVHTKKVWSSSSTYLSLLNDNDH